MELGDLEQRLREIYQDRHDKTLYVSGAGSLRYGDIVTVIDAAKGAGVTRVGVITEGMRAGGWRRLTVPCRARRLACTKKGPGASRRPGPTCAAGV